jgi:hypothetical protein
MSIHPSLCCGQSAVWHCLLQYHMPRHLLQLSSVPPLTRAEIYTLATSQGAA